jgi:hypothetical protein
MALQYVADANLQTVTLGSNYTLGDTSMVLKTTAQISSSLSPMIIELRGFKSLMNREPHILRHPQNLVSRGIVETPICLTRYFSVGSYHNLAPPYELAVVAKFS